MRNYSTTSCIYCASVANEREHVPPRCMLEKPYPINLKTLPACASCNRGYALDEEYFIVLLSQIGTVGSLSAKVEEGGVVDRALSFSKGLDDKIISSLSIGDDGRAYINPDIDRVNKIIGKIVLGLFVLKYHKVLSLSDIVAVEMQPYNIEEGRPADQFLATYSSWFKPKNWTVVQKDVFSYIFVKHPRSTKHLLCIMDFHATAWGSAAVPTPRLSQNSEQTEFEF